MAMGKNILRAEYGDPSRPLRIGGLEIPCYVLEDGTRVLSGRGMQTALGLGQRHGALLGGFLARGNLKSFIPKDLAMALEEPVRFIRPGRGGKLAVGFEATVLLDICDVILEARKSGSLTPTQLVVADQCEVLTRAFAKVGIVALIDEATGYQSVRHKEALQALLDKYLDKELAAWAKRFPDNFYEQIFRLRGWDWKGRGVNPPQVVAKYTVDFVYDRLAPGITQELKKRMPKTSSGRNRGNLHQLFTDEVGHPALAQHLHAVVTLMKASKNWQQFKILLDTALPKKGDQIEMNIEP